MTIALYYLYLQHVLIYVIYDRAIYFWHQTTVNTEAIIIFIFGDYYWLSLRSQIIYSYTYLQI